MNALFALPGQRPRLVLALIAAVSVALLAFGMYLQLVVGLEPCPMCIVQRYALILVALVAGIAACFKGRGWMVGGAIGMGAFAAFGAFTAARQSWLQWNPPEILSCGRDFFGMIESFPLRRAIPMIFRGLTIANWSFLWFAAFTLLAVWLLLARRPAA
jgi:protein dithiol:quinone oxidoreductase